MESFNFDSRKVIQHSNLIEKTLPVLFEIPITFRFKYILRNRYILQLFLVVSEVSKAGDFYHWPLFF